MSDGTLSCLWGVDWDLGDAGLPLSNSVDRPRCGSSKSPSINVSIPERALRSSLRILENQERRRWCWDRSDIPSLVDVAFVSFGGESEGDDGSTTVSSSADWETFSNASFSTKGVTSAVGTEAVD